MMNSYLWGLKCVWFLNVQIINSNDVIHWVKMS